MDPTPSHFQTHPYSPSALEDLNLIGSESGDKTTKSPQQSNPKLIPNQNVNCQIQNQNRNRNENGKSSSAEKCFVLYSFLKYPEPVRLEVHDSSASNIKTPVKVQPWEISEINQSGKWFLG
nr:uncharacterized protein LOC108011448 [Drosophila suzukii]